MANDRDCENCKHYKEVLCKGGIFYHSCESWDCEFEPKEDEPFEPCEDAISRQAVLDLLVKYDNDMKFDVYSEIFDNINKLPPVNPQKPICPSAGVDCEDCPAYEKKPNINEVLDKIRAEIEAYQSDAFYRDNVMMNKRMVLDIIDKYKAEGSGEE